jgi:hypothetical protein
MSDIVKDWQREQQRRQAKARYERNKAAGLLRPRKRRPTRLERERSWAEWLAQQQQQPAAREAEYLVEAVVSLDEARLAKLVDRLEAAGITNIEVVRVEGDPPAAV